MDGIVTETSAKAAAERWLGDLGAALDSADEARLAALFAEECHWRDILAFDWDLHTTSGAAAIARRMAPALARTAPRRLELAKGRKPPRPVTRAGTQAIEAIFTFETAVGPCNGVVRLVSAGAGPGGPFRAWTLMTSLDEIRGHEDPANGRRTLTGSAISAARTGPTAGVRPSPMPTATPPCWWWAPRRRA